jgi:protein-tyrosine phosphatase
MKRDVNRILFVCHGNICRSPMAEMIMKNLVKEAHIADRFYIESKATSTEELGSGIYPPANRVLAEHKIPNEGHRANQIKKTDYEKFDYIIGMDSANIRNINRIVGGDSKDKVFKLLTFAGEGRDVEDPWYTRDFEKAYSDILKGCSGLLEYIIEEKLD